MRSAFVLALVGAALTSAQNQTLSVFIPDIDPQPLDASVISANAATTSLAVGCPSDEDASDCGLGPGITIVHVSSSIWMGSMTPAGDSFSFSFSCTVAAASDSQAVCVESAGGENANFPGVSTTTYEGTDALLFPVTITAGQEKLSAAGGSGSATATAGSSTSGKASTGMTASASKPTASGSTATSSSGGASSTSSGAAPGFGRNGLYGGAMAMGLLAAWVAW